MLICADWRRYVMRTCVWQCSPSMFRALWSQLCRSTAARAALTADMSDMILSLHFVYSPAVLLYIIINILLLKRSIIAKSTDCADIFNNMLPRPLYSFCLEKGVESKEHLLRMRVQTYSMIICLRSLLCNTTALRMWIGLFSTCNVSAHAGLTSSLGHCIWTYHLMVFCTSRS